MAFDRIFELQVGFHDNSSTNKIGSQRGNISSGLSSSLDIDGLDIEFNITRSRAFSDNIAEFKIFNSKEETRTKILKRGNSIIFKTGYKDQGDPATIFMGSITEATSIKEFPNWVTTIKAATIQAMNQTLENTYIAFSYASDSRISQPLQQLASGLGLVIIGIENVASILLDNGIVYAGPAKQGLKYIANILTIHDIGIYIDNQEIVIYKLNAQDSTFNVVYLDMDSGLLNAHDITEYNTQLPQPQPKRVQFECLVVPKLQPNGLVKIVHPKINGVFVLDKINFVGNNYGGDNKCTCEATE